MFYYNTISQSQIKNVFKVVSRLIYLLEESQPSNEIKPFLKLSFLMSMWIFKSPTVKTLPVLSTKADSKLDNLDRN